MEPQHRNWGEFRVPSLRNVAETAPYMHNGSLATLEAVVRHYSEVDVERLHGDDGARLVRPLRLSAAGNGRFGGLSQDAHRPYFHGPVGAIMSAQIKATQSSGNVFADPAEEP